MENKLLIDKAFDLEKTTAKMNLSEVFADRSGTYLNEFTLFMAYFGCIPNFIQEVNINCKKANYWLVENYGFEIKQKYYNKRSFGNFQKIEVDDIFYFLYEDLIIYIDTSRSTVCFLYNKTELSKIEGIITCFQKFKKRRQKGKPEISLLIRTTRGIDSKSLSLTKQKISIENNYNKDFMEIHKTILKRLSHNNDKGLVMLHGKPGTGKTSYIRYLITSLKKNVIFLPPDMASAITDPNLIGILIDNPNSIFVIEDAENIIIDRNNSGSSAVSALLNISDGLLADCLNVQIICSFNTDIAKVDSALMRKGRLIAKYEFKELETEKAQRLSDKLGYKNKIERPMKLADIYNQNETSFQQNQTRNTIGFTSYKN